MMRCSSFKQVKCNWYRMGTVALTFKRNNCKAPLPEAASTFILRKNCSSNPTTNIGETPNKKHLLQFNLLSNHIEVRLIAVRFSTELQDTKNNFAKEVKS